MDDMQIAIKATLRTAKDEEAYVRAKLAGELRRLADEPSIVGFIHWRVIENGYPYTMAYQKCHMLLPRRLVATEEDLTFNELQELWKIKRDWVPHRYDQITENMAGTRSVLDHYHLHLLKFYDTREEMSL